jgi:hypothetical protein
MSELMPSLAAKEEGVCHTREECATMYSKIDAGKKAAAVSFLRSELLAEDIDEIKRLLKEHGPYEWLWHMYDKVIDKMSPEDKACGFAAMLSPHLGFGMGIRNLLRRGGFGEEQLGVHNLDDVYVAFIEEAVS